MTRTPYRETRPMHPTIGGGNLKPPLGESSPSKRTENGSVAYGSSSTTSGTICRSQVQDGAAGSKCGELRLKIRTQGEMSSARMGMEAYFIAR